MERPLSRVMVNRPLPPLQVHALAAVAIGREACRVAPIGRHLGAAAGHRGCRVTAYVIHKRSYSGAARSFQPPRISYSSTLRGGPFWRACAYGAGPAEGTGSECD